MFDRNMLYRNLVHDGFFENGEHSLNIIDDYHTKFISQEATEFYQNDFDGTGVREIHIYYQIKKINDDNIAFIRELSAETGIDARQLSSFLVFLLTFGICKYRNLRENLQEEYATGNANDNIEASRRFIRAMARIGVTVTYHPYSSLGFAPPFHGRYWINRNAGYIVDGSLNTYGRGRIFAQLMDRENYRIINELFHDEIRHRAAEYAPLDDDRLLEIHNRLSDYYRYHH